MRRSSQVDNDHHIHHVDDDDNDKDPLLIVGDDQDIDVVMILVRMTILQMRLIFVSWFHLLTLLTCFLISCLFGSSFYHLVLTMYSYVMPSIRMNIRMNPHHPHLHGHP